MDKYSAKFEKFDENVDCATIKALLYNVTIGIAKKRHSGEAKSAYNALIDLYWNYGQTPTFDVHYEQLKVR